LIPKEKRNPLKASSFGTGLLIRDALERGVSEIIVALGGSATVDGGLGLARALGYRLLDAQGNEVPDGGLGLLHLDRIDASLVHPRLLACIFRAAADVTNPLCGPQGAARVYGPQKGADAAMVDQLDRGLARLQEILLKAGLISDGVPGDGAAGGLGLALRAFCGAKIESGAELVISEAKLAEKLVGADLLITGEGRTDAQTRQGKLCARVSGLARSKGVKVVLISGLIDAPDPLADLADFACSCFPCRQPPAELMDLAGEALTRAAHQTAMNIASFFMPHPTPSSHLS
jgi:glycerate kinase